MLAGVPVMGPNAVTYGETPTIGLRLDGVPQRQGAISMEWRLDAVPNEEFQLIVSLWEANQKSIAVRWLNQKGDWETGNWTMLQPQVGRRQGYAVYGVVIKFLPVVYTGSGLPISTGETPTIYPGWGLANQPPTADISYSAAIVGDPQVVVQLNGSGSHDADGVIVAYTWSDNSAAFQAITGYPYFDPPHDVTGPTATFVYEFMAGMPNPLITLTVTDNAGLTGVKTIEINIALLMSQIALSGKKFAVAAGNVFYTLNGGLSFESITGFPGAAISVACPAGTIVWGNDAGQLCYSPLTNPPAFVNVFSFDDPTGLVTWVSVSKSNPTYVIAGTNKGEIAYSVTSGMSWAPLSSPGFAVVKTVFNQDVANEICAVGTDATKARVAITRDFGSSWQSDEAGLPTTGEARAIARSIRLRYVGTQATTTPLLAATGEAWIAVDLGVSADIQDLSLADGNAVVAGDAQGRIHKITETTLVSTVATGAGIVHCVTHDPNQSSVVLIGGNNGLYCTC